jgi:hypothetical protein
MKSRLLTSIQNKFQLSELFLMSDLHDKTMTDGAVKEELLRLTKAGQIKRFSYGVYFLPGNWEPSAIKAIELRYIHNGDDVFGFYTGPSFISYVLGSAPSLDSKIEIMTNRATSGKKSVYMFSKRFILRKPYFEITKENESLNAFLSYISMTSLNEIKANYSILANYIRKEHLSANDVMVATDSFPSKTASKLLATDLYRSLWKH